ncbi:uncharacterized protein G2W53_032429 [Senna tora]|uniref:Uncharacterized protein n=1 Tax=Senna tora TaxID=362788 RepID=A0A834SXK0_9FABA|nr:uncharacterized protein G2W53_032429 [Senna tora]
MTLKADAALLYVHVDEFADIEDISVCGKRARLQGCLTPYKKCRFHLHSASFLFSCKRPACASSYDTMSLLHPRKKAHSQAFLELQEKVQVSLDQLTDEIIAEIKGELEASPGRPPHVI